MTMPHTRAIVAGLTLSCLGVSSLLAAGCTRAPSFDILGSYFPAWLICVVLGLLLTVATRAVLARAQVPLVLPILVYPSLTALFTFALWLVIFR